MSTFLFDQIVFGPVFSRRLGVSLGINLLPVNAKVCSFNCIYCECGWNPEPGVPLPPLPKREEVKQMLSDSLKKKTQIARPLQVITFAGNGEPTLHPDFSGIIEDTVELRNALAPKVRIAVLSNSTRIHKPEVFNSLLKIDDNILKLDSVLSETIQNLNCPQGEFDYGRMIEQLKRFEGRVILQTLFVSGSFKGKRIDNSTEEEVSAWLKVVAEIKPQKVMIYTIARDTASEGLTKIPNGRLTEIAREVEKLGIKADVSG